MLQRLDTAVERTSGVLATLGAGILGLLALLIVIDIIGREIGTPVRGTVEIAAMTVASAAFLTIPYAMRRRGHVRSTIIVTRLPGPLRRGLDAFTYATGAVVFTLLAWAAWQPALAAFVSGAYEGEGALRVPTWPTRTIVFVASVVMVAECVMAILRPEDEQEPAPPPGTPDVDAGQASETVAAPADDRQERSDG